eukprot:1666920-Rhodomonas_salina.1
MPIARERSDGGEQVVMPIARAFGPQLVLVSAGFDAARGDPLGGCDLTPYGYAMVPPSLHLPLPLSLILSLSE